MKNYKLNLNTLSNILKKNKIFKKTNIILEDVKKHLSIVHFKKKIIQKYKEFHEEKFKISYLAFIFSLLFFYYLIYLSFPGILHSKKDQSYFTKIFEQTVWTRVCFNSRDKLFDFTFKPHFQINDVIIFNKKNDFQMEIAQVKKLKIYLTQKKFSKNKN